MTEQQAVDAGYRFQGAYSPDRERAKQKAAELRAAGNKAVVVFTSSSPRSRGFRTGGLLSLLD